MAAPIDLVPAVYAGGDMLLRPADGLMIFPGDEVHVLPELVDVTGSPYVAKVTKAEEARLAKLASNLKAGLTGGPLED